MSKTNTKTIRITATAMRLGAVKVHAGSRYEAEIKSNTPRGNYDGYAVINVEGYGPATIAPHHFEIVADYVEPHPDRVKIDCLLEELGATEERAPNWLKRAESRPLGSASRHTHLRAANDAVVAWLALYHLARKINGGPVGASVEIVAQDMDDLREKIDDLLNENIGAQIEASKVTPAGAETVEEIKVGPVEPVELRELRQNGALCLAVARDTRNSIEDRRAGAADAVEAFEKWLRIVETKVEQGVDTKGESARLKAVRMQCTIAKLEAEVVSEIQRRAAAARQ